MFYSVTTIEKSKKADFTDVRYYEKYSTALAAVDSIIETLECDVTTRNDDCKASDHDTDMCAYILGNEGRKTSITIVIKEHDFSDVFYDDDEDDEDDE